jgi:trimeric autotransporter adhesin
MSIALSVPCSSELTFDAAAGRVHHTHCGRTHAQSNLCSDVKAPLSRCNVYVLQAEQHITSLQDTVAVLEGSLTTARQRASAAEANSTATHEELAAAVTDLKSRDATITRLRAELRACGHSGSSTGGLAKPVCRSACAVPALLEAGAWATAAGSKPQTLIHESRDMVTSSTQTDDARDSPSARGAARVDSCQDSPAPQRSCDSPGATADLDALWQALQETQAAAAASSAARAEAVAAAAHLQSQLASAHSAHAAALRDVATAARLPESDAEPSAPRLVAQITARVAEAAQTEQRLRQAEATAATAQDDLLQV